MGREERWRTESAWCKQLYWGEGKTHHLVFWPCTTAKLLHQFPFRAKECSRMLYSAIHYAMQVYIPCLDALLKCASRSNSRSLMTHHPYRPSRPSDCPRNCNWEYLLEKRPRRGDMDLLSALAAVVDAHAPTDRSVTYTPLPDVLNPLRVSAQVSAERDSRVSARIFFILLSPASCVQHIEMTLPND
jgi:hypothetical protein